MGCTPTKAASTYALPTLAGGDGIAPYWLPGLACGLGGLIGGNIGARLQPRLPGRFLLDALTTAVGALYAVQALA